MAKGDRYVGAIESFKGQIKSIQRASLFDVEIPNFKYATTYTGGNTNYILSFSVKTANFPNTNVGDIDVKYMGRSIHWYGDRTFNAQWATTCILDGQWQVFNAIYAWHQGIGGSERIVSEDLNSHDNFKQNAYVTAYTTDGQIAHRVMLVGLWPQDIGEMGLDWGSADTPLDLAVTWVYDYVLTVDTNTPDASAGNHEQRIPDLES